MTWLTSGVLLHVYVYGISVFDGNDNFRREYQINWPQCHVAVHQTAVTVHPESTEISLNTGLMGNSCPIHVYLNGSPFHVLYTRVNGYNFNV